MTEKPKRKNTIRKKGFWYYVFVGLIALWLILLLPKLPKLLLGFVISPSELLDECELYVNGHLHLRIESYISYFDGHPRHYQVSHDGGETWQTFHSHVNVDDGVVSADCREFQIYSPARFYLLPSTSHQSYLMLTNDAGRTWHTWTPDSIDHPEGVRCNHIQDLNFQDSRVGEMQVHCSGYDENKRSISLPSVNLSTTDGGITWTTAND